MKTMKTFAIIARAIALILSGIMLTATIEGGFDPTYTTLGIAEIAAFGILSRVCKRKAEDN